MPRDRQAHPRILLVEDDDVEREVMSTVLTRRQCQVFTSPDAEAALRYFEDHTNFDLVILDLHLEGGMDGAAATAEFKRICAGVEVLIVTGDCGSMLADKALAAGAVKVLCKPFMVTELLGIIENIVNPNPDT